MTFKHQLRVLKRPVKIMYWGGVLTALQKSDGGMNILTKP